MRKVLSLIILTIFVGLSSCKKENNAVEGTVSNMSDLKVPVGFTWENSKDIYFDITITDARFNDALHVVSIYDADPALNGKLLSKGSASLKLPFTTKVYLPNTVKEVFVVKTAPDNTSSMQKVAISGLKLSVQLSSTLKADLNTLAGTNTLAGIDDSPTCTTGCTQTITTSNTNINVNNGDLICITGSNITVGFNGNGGTIRICGTNVTVQNASLNNSALLIITKTGSATFNNLNMNGSNSTFINYGTATVNGSFSPGGSFTNENTFSTTGDFSLNSNSNFMNHGIMNVGGTMNVNTVNVTSNNGSITTAQNFQLNENSHFVNNCFLWVKANYNHNNNSILKNYSLIKVNNTTTLNGSSGELALYNGAMLRTTNLTINNKIKGYGTTSLVKVSANTTINSGKIENAIQFCDLNGIETNNNAQFTGGAVQACTLYIPVTNCNTEGNGTAPPADSDGDGVMDALDEYPNDPTKAYNNYYPSSSPSSGATVAFEDQWPVKGDYDLNDVVVSYRYKIVTNAQNRVVQVNGDYTLHATGSGYETGFGVEFPTLRSSVSGVSGGILEAGQTKAVIKIFNDIRDEMQEWNTLPGKPVSPLKNYSVSFNVSNGPALNTFGLGSYNPFIWNGGLGNGRNHEIHLPGKTPTSLGTTSLFGTGDDNSSVSAARYYVTSTGLPWAIDIPIKPFNYPVEYMNITGGYLKFQAWAESGGTQFVDWYSNTQSGYRNNGNLFLP
ncbi:MAG: LruC domain-containing protein [Daejeonella sp.]|uniref:LruC domain-containing protein n=1 Tax=Daejeonella sp. TaxID=2805397 RepID=UPI002736DEA7|nr:LruC domain-containing protein [Daejeonella sp.]MDP3468947.1 LruC domain-containing protein [Daejeonella sp.]